MVWRQVCLLAFLLERQRRRARPGIGRDIEHPGAGDIDLGLCRGANGGSEHEQRDHEAAGRRMNLSTHVGPLLPHGLDALYIGIADRAWSAVARQSGVASPRGARQPLASPSPDELEYYAPTRVPAAHGSQNCSAQWGKGHSSVAGR